MLTLLMYHLNKLPTQVNDNMDLFKISYTNP